MKTNIYDLKAEALVCFKKGNTLYNFLNAFQN